MLLISVFNNILNYFIKTYKLLLILLILLTLLTLLSFLAFLNLFNLKYFILITYLRIIYNF